MDASCGCTTEGWRFGCAAGNDGTSGDPEVPLGIRRNQWVVPRIGVEEKRAHPLEHPDDGAQDILSQCPSSNPTNNNAVANPPVSPSVKHLVPAIPSEGNQAGSRSLQREWGMELALHTPEAEGEFDGVGGGEAVELVTTDVDPTIDRPNDFTSDMSISSGESSDAAGSPDDVPAVGPSLMRARRTDEDPPPGARSATHPTRDAVKASLTSVRLPRPGATCQDPSPEARSATPLPRAAVKASPPGARRPIHGAPADDPPPRARSPIPLPRAAMKASPPGARRPIDPFTTSSPAPTQFPGLDPPRLNSGAPVTGTSKNVHRRENKRVRENKQQNQPSVSNWATHRGEFKLPPERMPPANAKGGMCPQGLALHHPAADHLLEYATKGCPSLTGQPWTVEQMQAAVDRGPHVSAKTDEVMAQFKAETLVKAEQGQCKLVPWDDIKDDPPKQLKISPIAAAPHKSRKWRAILDLSFALRLSDGSYVPAVNDTTTKTAPAGAIDQMGHSLIRIIHAFAEADEEAKIFMAKWDVKDGFWRLNCEEGEEYNFAYVLPQPEGEPPILVVPTSLQMGWIESPPYFCAASETGRDVAEQYAERPVGSLPPHKFLRYATGSDAYKDLPPDCLAALLYMYEVYVDDYISIAMPLSQRQLDHLANAMGHGIHDVFPTSADPVDDAMAFKKMERGDCLYDTKKDILGFNFDGILKTIWLEDAKRESLLTILGTWSRRASLRRGTPWQEYLSVTAKIRHAFLSVPAGKGLLSPFNRLMSMQPPPPVVYFHRNTSLRNAVSECRALLLESTKSPTKCRELVSAWPDYVGVKDASRHGVGGVIVGERLGCPPTVFRLQWPEDIQNDMKTKDNPNGTITNSDLEMAGLVLLFLVMEDVCGDLREKHVALFSDNSPTVSWVRRMASRRSLVAEQLVRALALRLKESGASPLTPFHIRGIHNAMTDIPSRSWGSVPKWHCKSHDELLTLFNARFPLPHKASWNVYQISTDIATRVISALRHKRLSMDEWRRLPPRGKNIGTTGPAMSELWEWTLTFRENPTRTASSPSLDSPPEYERGSSVEENRLELEQFLRRSQPLARRSPWPSAPILRNKRAPKS